MKVFSFVGVALLFVCQWAHSFSPAPGLWWNPGESGRGYAIDFQNGVMIVTVYIYNSSGAPLWYLASGTYNDASSTFTTQLGQFSGGQCFGCPYSHPTGVSAGNFSITFTSFETGTLFYPGGSTAIQHEIYGYPNKQDYLFGEWSFGQNTFGLIDSQWIVFDSNYTGSDSTVYVQGHQDGDSTTLALGTYDTFIGKFIIVILDSAGFFRDYTLTGDDRRMIGTGELVAPGGTPTGSGVTSTGGRLLSENEIGTLSNQPSAKAIASSDPTALRRLESELDAMKAALAHSTK